MSTFSCRSRRLTTTNRARCLVVLSMIGCLLAIISSTITCLTINTMTTLSSVRRTNSRLYNGGSYDDQYAKFYNTNVPTNDNDDDDDDISNGSTEAVAALEMMGSVPLTEELTTERVGDDYLQNPPAIATADADADAGFGSYLETLGGISSSTNGAIVEEQTEQVYYEATNSYGAPPVQSEVFEVEEEIENKQQFVMMALDTVEADEEEIEEELLPNSFISDRAPPLQYDTSPTLSAESPTISITLPVGLRPPKLDKAKDISYGENSRKFRRTVYSHEDWVRHRSPDRFFRYVASVPTSGIYKNIGGEIWVLTAITCIVLLYNGLITGYQDINGIVQEAVWSNPLLPPLTLPLQPFTLSSPSLGLLLVFRSNTAYQRWDEARKNWGMNINHTRDLNRMANAYYDRTGVPDEKRKADLERLSLFTWAFVRSMKRHLSPEGEDEAAFKAELYERLPKTQAQQIIKAAHRPNRALYDLSLAIENLPMHFLRKNEMHAALTIFEDNLGSSERLLTSPVPLIYNRHTARFLLVWLLLLPFALWEPFGFMWNHIGLLPTMAMLGLMLFGIEELATQLEEPFTLLPMQAFCDKIGNWCNEIASWEDGTNGLTTNRSYQGRTKVYVDKS
mmetsp:Transcript_12475/g.13835  ORF Transcript_12475/g.13835 Transcript_12475/m.13835 type:complete len:621 (-) Transcript_12475:248-2110(-)